MKVIVTGGAGFIGSHVVGELLEKKHEVYVIDDFSSGKLENISEYLPFINVICCDITSCEYRKIAKRICPDYVIHLAAQASVAVSQKDPFLDVKTNLLGLVNILESCRELSCKKIVFAASGGTIYGDVPEDNLPITEDLPLKACSFYGLTKMTSVHYLELYKKHFGLDYCALALGNVYGPKQDPYGESGVVAIFTNKFINNEECRINGDGSVTRDYVYCKDIARAFVMALEKGHGIINLGTGVETSVTQVYEMIKIASGRTAPLRHVAPLPGEVKRVALSNSKAKLELGWEPQFDFNNGIKLTYEAEEKRGI
ncbi:NAD-dependent epimerase/dehydratase family protein [Ruminococcus flavefaciens]|uniref:UDP-glucose 4-epimerase n=1 Tax=Ruminococcus flavefaciens TaxID=1265 RepID=A0A1M7GBU3_RUMFL|nr:NAD-dependent epimerase/dehydratase family protein [Ruminococcus flavefaciens]SHM13852.1 UDP-glucose 4-epimerase [Ruminococcus flavefaciens]